MVLTKTPTLVSPSSTGNVSKATNETVAQKISEDMQQMSVNEGPHFSSPQGEGDLRIEIVKTCHYAYQVTYSLVTNQKQILKTGLIHPGEYVLEKPLEIALKAGTYPVIALFTAYDMETKQSVGKTAQAMTFYVGM
ncbi:MAG: hypothetical protein RR496_05450 [Lachnospiraceae bacterium]